MSYRSEHDDPGCDCGLLHPVPCWKCPFLRLSPRMGRDECQKLLAAVDDEIVLRCIDDRRNDGCVGVLIYLRNTVVVPRQEEIRYARSCASADLETVFGSAREMMTHHSKKEKKT